jgi:hypothetical protein
MQPRCPNLSRSNAVTKKFSVMYPCRSKAVNAPLEGGWCSRTTLPISGSSRSPPVPPWVPQVQHLVVSHTYGAQRHSRHRIQLRWRKKIFWIRISAAKLLTQASRANTRSRHAAAKRPRSHAPRPAPRPRRHNRVRGRRNPAADSSAQSTLPEDTLLRRRGGGGDVGRAGGDPI